MEDKIWNKFVIKILGFFIVYTKGELRIEVPAAGNCGNDTLLKCHFTGQLGTPVGWTLDGRKFLHNGIVVRPEDVGKYTEKRDQIDQGFVTLVIHNTARSDEAKYGCQIGFDQTGSPVDRDKHLFFECKASSAAVAVKSSKKLQFTVDKLYPSNAAFGLSIQIGNTAITVQGSRTCTSSKQYSGYYKCVWTSSSSGAEGSYTYSLVVTTITKADSLKGSFKIVSPQTPAISNVVKLEDNREIVYGNESQSITIQCTSSGGFPAPTVVWYKDSISSSNQMASTSTGTLQGDGTYSVILQHTFTPTTSDDRKTLICRSYYPQADSAYRGSKSKSVIFYLTLKPSLPTVTQTAVVSAGNTVEVSCRTTGGRPAANISWSYQGSTTTGEVTATLDTATEAYTTVSSFKRLVTAADNGRYVKCVVTHPALLSPSERTASINLNVRFSVGPASTRITGNKEMVATGQTALTLTCTTGSSNPASDITWKNGSVTLTSSRPYMSSAGDNNGVVRSQQLILYPTRYMDGDVTMCSVSNMVSQSDVVDTITLNLKYRPLIDSMSQVIAVEGNNTVLTCAASSKPASTFKWYRVGQSGILSQGTGTLDSNKWSYTINNVRRTYAATYRCNVINGIETADNGNVLLTVYYPPDVTVTATNTTVKATTALITCKARGVPNSNYKYGKWIQTWPGFNVPVSESPGSEKLMLTHLTYEYSGVYTCSASNGIKIFGTNKEFMEGSVYLLVKSHPIITQLSEKTPGRLKENATMEIRYYSNGARSRVNIYKNIKGSRQAGVIYTVSESHAEIDLPVFSHIIKTDGSRARILLQIQSKEDFGSYDVVVSNEIDSTTRTFEIVPLEVPGSSATVTAGAVGGTISALIVIVAIVIIIVLVRRGIITKDSLRTRVQTAIVCVGKKQKDPLKVETDGQDNSIRMYEHLQHTTDSGETNVYDALKVDHETTGNSKSKYENLPQRVSTSPTYMNVSAGKLNKNANQTYENLKLRSEITGGQ